MVFPSMNYLANEQSIYRPELAVLAYKCSDAQIYQASRNRRFAYVARNSYCLELRTAHAVHAPKLRRNPTLNRNKCSTRKLLTKDKHNYIFFKIKNTNYSIQILMIGAWNLWANIRNTS